MEEDLHSVISPEQITEFERSKAARDAICLLGQLSDVETTEVTQNQYTLIRDFLLVEISIDNANRAGALANMNLKEFQNSVKRENELVILVRKHKTGATHGPARIVLSPKLQSWIAIFVKKVRCKLPGVADGHSERVFLSWNGEALKSSQINKAIKSVWKKARMVGSPSSTLFRKSAVSEVHITCHSNEEQGNLADLMAHNVDTARKFYRLQEKSKSSVKASKQLRNVMRGKIAEECEQGKNNQVDKSLPASEKIVSKTSKFKWTTEMEELIKNVFKDEIENKAVTIQDVREKISHHPQFSGLKPKSVLDKVRAQWRFRRSTTTEGQLVSLPADEESLHQCISRSLSQDNSSEIIPRTISGASVRGVFSEGDLENIRMHFSDMIRKSVPIRKQNIKEALEKEPWGNNLLKKVTLDTIFNRIKYERRVHRSSK